MDLKSSLRINCTSMLMPSRPLEGVPSPAVLSSLASETADGFDLRGGMMTGVNGKGIDCLWRDREQAETRGSCVAPNGQDIYLGERSMMGLLHGSRRGPSPKFLRRLIFLPFWA